MALNALAAVRPLEHVKEPLAHALHGARALGAQALQGVHLLAAHGGNPLVYHTGTQIGTAQDETMAILLGTFMAVVIVSLFWLRSGHERARRTVVSAQQRDRELARERSRILEAHDLPPRYGESAPR